MVAQTRQKMSQSQIPMMAPRPSQSSLPSSLSTPHLGLAPSGRHLAVSASPSHPPTTASNSAASTSTPFRSFRNFLSFGPAKGHSSNAGPSTLAAVAGPSRPSLGSLKRSLNGERSVSAPNLPATDTNSTPVLTIELSHKVDEPLIDSAELESRLLVQPSTPEGSSPSLSASTDSSRLTPEQPAAGFDLPRIYELSTIIEAETSASGISRHLPEFEDSKDLTSTNQSQSRSPNPSEARMPESSVHDTSVLDLSTSELNKEVLAALSQSGPQEGWTDGVVVDSTVDSPTSPTQGALPEVSFSLGAVDPDLAALLSPHYMKASEPALLVAIDAVSSPLRSPTLVDTEPSSPVSPTHLSPDSQTPPQSAARRSSLPRPSPSSRPSLDRSASSSTSRVPIPSSSATRLSRSASERPSFSGSERTYLPSSARKPDVSDGRPSLQLSRRRQSPLLQESPLPRPSSSHGVDYKSAASRLATPARHLGPLGNARNGIRLPPSPHSSPGYDPAESVSSRSPGAGTSRRPAAVRPSLDGLDRPRTRTRDRSASLTEGSPYDPPARRPADWLGPRTTRAFAAAGLLDSEREGASRPGSRFSASRESRAHYAPSRAGFSDASSPSTWGRRSGSGFGGSSESPRSASSAPTSVEAGAGVQRVLQEEIAALQDKHALETGALLAALADSQRTTRVLREENATLRERLGDLEERLAGAHEEARRTPFAQGFNPPMTSTLGRSSSSRFEPPLRRHASRLQTLVRSSAEELRERPIRDIPPRIEIPRPDTASAASSTHRRRLSGASSIFPPPPSNMTMLLHDEPGAPPGSPPLSMRDLTLAHAPRKSVDSGGGSSPTTAAFSMITGSPGSLWLRPEHELLLGDMPTLELGVGEYAAEEEEGFAYGV